ncbi:MAG TPA: GAF domain-containing SpoIIE family protein phosphatase [Terriglobales bacterium]|nr:GAF domain-containing SpoIIE family protein phosphatase [Terriglobales bacterium]
MAASPSSYAIPTRRPDAQVVRDLLKLQRSAQRISSILDVDLLMDKIAHEIVETFGAIEASVWLSDHPRGEMVVAGVRGCTVHTKGHRFKIGKEGMVGWVAANGRTRYAPDVSLDPHYVGCEEGTRSEIVVPLRTNGELIGVLCTGHSELDGFSEWQRQMLEQLAEQIAVAVHNARQYQREQSLRAAQVKEAEEARIVQEALLPKASPFAAGFAVQGRTLPAGAVGGDWYDFIPLSDGKWGIVLADVSGKGMAAALLMSATRAALRSMADTCFGPGGVLQKLNRQLINDFPAGRYVTMVFGIFDPAARKLTFANAGHPAPLMLQDGEVRPLPTEKGLPLGIAPSSYSEVDIDLKPGTRVLFYSDGISEAVNAEDEEFGEERILAELARPVMCGDLLMDDIKLFAGGTPQHDDATVILIRAE